MSRQSNIEMKLKVGLQPLTLNVINESHLHAGHHHASDGHEATFDGSGETHFRIRVISEAFSGKSRIDRHRTINALLADELEAGLHALAIEAHAPGEPVRW